MLESKYDYVSNTEYGVRRVSKEKKWGILDGDGKEILPLTYEYIYMFENGFSQVKWGSYYGIIDTKGKVIIKPEYVRIEQIDKDLFTVFNGRHWGMINRYGILVAPIMYDDEIKFKDRDKAVVKFLGKYNIMNKTGKMLLTEMYDMIEIICGVYIISNKSNRIQIYF